MPTTQHTYFKGGLLLAVLALALSVVGAAQGALTPFASSSGAAAPTIRSDKDDYTPGETVTLSGANWQPGEAVHIFVNDDKGQSWSRNADVVAGIDGTIEDRFALPDSFIAAYSVTATGPLSGTATTSFTDGNVKFDVAPSGVEAQFVETLYAAATNCTGAAKSGFPKTLSNSDGDTVGVGNNESLRIDAAATSDDGRPFQAWSSPDSPASPFSVIAGTGGRSICIPGFQTGTRNYRATYGAAPAANSAPTVAANNASVTVNEGQTAANSGTYSDANAGDTVSISASVGTVTKTGTNSGTWSWSYATTDGPDNGQTVTITANDGNGGVSTTTFALVVNNVAPTVALSADATADEGQTKTYTFTVTDPGADTFSVSAGFPDCGTGGGLVGGSLSTNAGGGSFQCSFPDGPATPTVRMQVADSDGAASNVATLGVTVANVAPSGTFANTGPVTEGASFQLSLSGVTDPSAADTAAGFTYAFDCGDGAGYSAYGAASTRTCPTSDNGNRSVGAKVKDKDNGEREYTDTVVVNNAAPTITSVTNNGPINEGSAAMITVTATDPAGAADPLAYEFDCGNDGIYEIGPQAGNSASCSFADNGSRDVNVRVTDGDGGAATGSTTVTVYNVAPTITNVTNNGPIDEGSSATITVTATDPGGIDDPLAYEFDCGNDGTYEIGPQAGNSTNCSFADNGARQVNVRVSDDDGGAAASSTTVTVKNLPPVLTGQADQSSDEGDSHSFDLGSFSDPGANDSPWHVHVDWGDAQSSDLADETSQGSLGNAAHTYADNGTYTVTVKVTDKDGGIGTASFKATVANRPPVLTPPSDDNGVEGTSKSFGLGSFTDPGANDNPWHLHITWGDGSAATDLDYSSRGPLGMAPHTYDDNGVYTVTETITDKDGGSDTQTFKVTIANANPTATLANNGPIDEGGTATVSFSAQQDPSSADTAAGFHYAYACDNGSLAGATYANSGTSGSHQCSFAQNGSYPVKARIIDKDGGFGEYTTTVVVNNVRPSVTAPADQTASEGATTTFELGSFTDPGPDAPWSVNVTWGDGSAATAFTAAAPGSLGTATHKYADNGEYTVTVKVTDKDGGYGSATFKVTVSNVKPTIANFTGTGSLFGPLVFAPSTFSGTFSDPGVNDKPWAATWKWDGVADASANQAYNVMGPFSQTHTFTTAGCSHTAEVRITDKDGAFDTASTNVQVGTGAFLPPMTNQPVTDKLKNGQVLPVKVEIMDCNGQPVTNLQPAIQLKRGDLTQGLSDDSLVTITPESVSSADTTGVMRLVDGHYQYNMKVNVPSSDVGLTDYTVMIYPYGLSSTAQTLRHVIRATK